MRHTFSLFFLLRAFVQDFHFFMRAINDCLIIIIIIGGVPKFGHISAFMSDVHHWLSVQQRIHYRVSIVWYCVLGRAPAYLRELFTLTSACSGRRSLRSAS